MRERGKPGPPEVVRLAFVLLFICTNYAVCGNNEIVPTVLRMDGFRFFFFSNEGWEPAHVHVESAESYAKFWLFPVRLAHSKGYNAPTLNKLHSIVRANESLFEEQWNEYFAG